MKQCKIKIKITNNGLLAYCNGCGFKQLQKISFYKQAIIHNKKQLSEFKRLNPSKFDSHSEFVVRFTLDQLSKSEIQQEIISINKMLEKIIKMRKNEKVQKRRTKTRQSQDN